MGSIQAPTLQRIHRSETDKIIQAIVDDGGVIIKNFATTEAVERVNADTKPYFDADKPWKVDTSPFPLVSSPTQSNDTNPKITTDSTAEQRTH
jgi:microsomal dipeptidase-like Zn-dependent dipeptidase